MADSLKLYKVKISGLDHILQLSAEDAKRYGKNVVAYNGKAPAPGTAADSGKDSGADADKSDNK